MGSNQVTATPPAGYVVENNGGPFTEFVGPLYRKTEAAPGQVAKAFLVLPQHCNMAGLAHGGMLCTFLDNLFGTTAETTGSGLMVTATLNTQFLAAARAGDWVEGEAEIVRAGKRLVFLRGKLAVAGRPILTGDACFARVGT